MRRIYLETMMPFAMRQGDDGAWRLLNRDLNPVGQDGPRRIDAEAHPGGFGFAGASREAIAGIASHREGDLFFLYDPSLTLRQNKTVEAEYLGRLASLATFDPSEARCWLPYAMQMVAPNRWAFTNREHRPLGVSSGSVVSLEVLERGSVLMRQIPDTAIETLSRGMARRGGLIRLYDETCDPWAGAEPMKAYLSRIRILMGIGAGSEPKRLQQKRKKLGLGHVGASLGA